jgi:predicted Zn finger-like uncharacterized protein
MIITCQNCGSSYHLDETLLAPGGSRVRCSNCSNLFVAYPPPAAEAAGAAPGQPEWRTTDPSEALPDDEPAQEADSGLEEFDLGLDLNAEGEGKGEEPTETGLSLDMEWEGLAESDKQASGALMDLEMEALASRPEAQDDPGSEGNLELDLELDLDSAPGVPRQPAMPQAAETGAREDDLDLELDLDLDLDGPPPPEAEAAGPDLPATPGQAPPGTVQSPAGDDAFDLKAFEAALDLDGPTPDRARDALELDLDLPLDGEEDGSESRTPGEEVLDADVELDLSEIEKMLEEDDLGDAVEASPAAEAAAGKPESSRRAVDGEDDDLFNTQELGQVAALFEEGAGATLAEDKTLDDGVTERFGRRPEPQDLATAAPEADLGIKRGPSPVLVILLIILVLCGGVYGAHLMGARIPVVSEWLTPPVKDELGNLKISTLDIDSRFVDNAQAGRLFVITGKVRNDYPGPRSFIQVQGSLYQKGKKLAATRSVFCGNLLADMDLARLEMGEIQKRLDLRSGANKSNLNVPGGGVLPFMVVFDNLPPDLEEFTIEVARSQ